MPRRWEAAGEKVDTLVVDKNRHAEPKAGRSVVAIPPPPPISDEAHLLRLTASLERGSRASAGGPRLCGPPRSAGLHLSDRAELRLRPVGKGRLPASWDGRKAGDRQTPRIMADHRRRYAGRSTPRPDGPGARERCHRPSTWPSTARLAGVIAVRRPHPRPRRRRRIGALPGGGHARPYADGRQTPTTAAAVRPQARPSPR